MKFWMTTFGAMISAGLLAQTNLPDTTTTTATTVAAPVYSEITNAPPAAPMPAPKAKKKTVKKAAVKKAAKPAEVLRTVPLVPGPAVVAANHVNVRTKPSIGGEIVTRMTNGEPVTVIEEIKLKHSGPDEPSAWAKIALPSQAAAWVNTKFIDSTNKVVTAKKLNIRGGPGENYGVIGTLQKGDAINEIITQGEWTKIEAPTTGYAFMAAQYLKQEPGEMPTPTPAPETNNVEPATPVTPVTETPAVPATTEAPAPAPTNEVPVAAPAPAPEAAPAPAPATEEQPTEPRVVSHEGVVHGTVSIQAPTPYELRAPDTGEVVDYLFTNSKELDLSRYKGLHIIVTGEESLDQRWPHTPLITIQKIQVIE